MEDVFEKVYNNLMHCYYYNKKAKSGRSNKGYYVDKHKIIMDSVDLICSNKDTNIKIKISRDKNQPNFILVHFYFHDSRAEISSVSFHIPDYYETIILQKIK